MVVQVAVCGPGKCSDEETALAWRVGRLLAERGAVVLCGGGTGVMAAVAEGARTGGGLVVGIRPDGERGAAYAGLSATVFTGLGEARNAVLVNSADAVISVGGSWGTLSEIALALRRGGVPVVCLAGWQVRDGVGAVVAGPVPVGTPEEAVAIALGVV